MTRAQTLVLAFLIVNFLLGAICLAAARGERTLPALRLWGWGTLIYSAGLLITTQQWGSAAVGLTLGNALIAWSPIIGVEGVLAHTSHRLSRRLAYGALAIVIGMLIYGNFIAGPRALINLLAPMPIAIATFAMAAYWLYRTPPTVARTATMFLAGTMLLAIVVWILRIAFLRDIAGLSEDDDSLDQAISLFAIAQIVVTVVCTMTLLWIEVRKMELVVTRFALTDVLTELPNRDAIIQRYREEESQAVRHGKPFALLIFEIDHFDQFGESDGGPTGDAVLCHVADCLSAARRAGDTLGCVGAGEFVILLIGDMAIAQGAAERLRLKVQESRFDFGETTHPVTVSGGLAVFPADGVDWKKLFETADQRLQVSKHAGHNRVTWS